MKFLKLGLVLAILLGATPLFGQNGKAKLFIIRNAPGHSIYPASVFVNGKEVGVNHGATYIEVDVDPGSVVISGSMGVPFNMMVSAGNTYYIQHKVGLSPAGLTSRFKYFAPGRGELARYRCRPGGAPGTGTKPTRVDPRLGYPPLPPQ